MIGITLTQGLKHFVTLTLTTYCKNWVDFDGPSKVCLTNRAVNTDETGDDASLQLNARLSVLEDYAHGRTSDDALGTFIGRCATLS
jgi:hypothetical protein